MFWLLLGCAAQARGDRVDELAQWCESVVLLDHVQALPTLDRPPQDSGSVWVIEADDAALVMPYVGRDGACGGARTPCTPDHVADQIGARLYQTVGVAGRPDMATGRWSPVVQHLMTQEGSTLRLVAWAERPPRLGRNPYAESLDALEGEPNRVVRDALAAVGCPPPSSDQCDAADLRAWFRQCDDPHAAQGAWAWFVSQERAGTFVDIALDPAGQPVRLDGDLPWQEAVSTLAALDGPVALDIEPAPFVPAALPGGYDALYTSAWRDACHVTSPMAPGLRTLGGPPTRVDVSVLTPEDAAVLPPSEQTVYVGVFVDTPGPLLAQVVQRHPQLVLVGATNHGLPPSPDPDFVSGITAINDGRHLAFELVAATQEACPDAEYAITGLFGDDCDGIASALDELAVTCGAETGNRFAALMGAGLPQPVTALQVQGAVDSLPDATLDQVLYGLTLVPVTPPTVERPLVSSDPPEWGARALMLAIQAGQAPQGEIQVRGRALTVDGPDAEFEGGLTVRLTRQDPGFYSHLQPGDVGWVIGTWDGQVLQAAYVDWMQPYPPESQQAVQAEPPPAPTGKKQTPLVAEVQLPPGEGTPVPMAGLVVPTHGAADPLCTLIADPIAIQAYVRHRDEGPLPWQAIVVTPDRLAVGDVELTLQDGRLPPDHLRGDLVAPVYDVLLDMRKMNQPCRSSVPVVLLADKGVPPETVTQLSYTAGQAGVTLDRAVQPTGRKLRVDDTLYVVREKPL